LPSLRWEVERRNVANLVGRSVGSHLLSAA
jgi:hypothetical protein